MIVTLTTKILTTQINKKLIDHELSGALLIFSTARENGFVKLIYKDDKGREQTIKMLLVEDSLTGLFENLNDE